MQRRTVSPEPITGSESTADLIRNAYSAFVGRDVREALRLMKRSVDDDYFVFLTLSGAMTPAGLHHSCIIPLIEKGLVHCLTTTGANVYHDLHRSIGYTVDEISPSSSDIKYRQEETVRIYNLGITTEILCETDKFLGSILRGEAFQRPMATPELHYEVGRVLAEHEERAGVERPSLLSTCFRHGVPIFCGAPQDGSLYLESVQLALLEKSRFEVDTRRDVLLMAAIQWITQREGQTAIWVLGGGVPKNYTLQGEPTMSQVLGIPARGFDLDVQICVDVSDNGALSPCTAGEGHTWGKTTAECVESQSVYLRSDVTIALPLLTHALLGEISEPRPQKRLYDRLPEAERLIREEFKRIFSQPDPPLYTGY